MAKNLYNVGDICKITRSFDQNKIGTFVTIKKVCKTQALVVFPDGEEAWMDYDSLGHGKDMVNHPQHYVQNGIECFDVIRAAIGTDGLTRFCEGNIIKYAFRMRHKGSYIKDVGKIKMYAEEIIKLFNEDSHE